jgi:agmatine deiminase
MPGFTPGTPAALGFRMPAEWAPHRGTWLSWPHRESSWPDRFAPVPTFVEIVRHRAPRGGDINVAPQLIPK